MMPVWRAGATISLGAANAQSQTYPNLFPTVTLSPRSSKGHEKGDKPMMRRRPLRRAAVVGGVAAAAHHAGTKSAQAQAAAQEQNEQIAELQAQQAQPQYAPPPAAPVAPEVGGDM